MTERLRAGLLLVALCLVAGCATRPTFTLPPMESWEARQRVLGGLADWRARGRIGIVAGSQAESGSLDWQQEERRARVSIRGPLGAGGLLLEGDGESLRLTGSDGEAVLLTRPEEELRELYGWTIPVASLAYWMRGVPDPSRPADYAVDPGGMLERLTQAGWDITYAEYRPVAGALLPYRVKARSGDIRLTIVLKDWQFGTASGR